MADHKWNKEMFPWMESYEEPLVVFCSAVRPSVLLDLLPVDLYLVVSGFLRKFYLPYAGNASSSTDNPSVIGQRMSNYVMLEWNIK